MCLCVCVYHMLMVCDMHVCKGCYMAVYVAHSQDNEDPYHVNAHSFRGVLLIHVCVCHMLMVCDMHVCRYLF
jgi:hypothetical protein